MNFLRKNYKYIILLLAILFLVFIALILEIIKPNNNLANVGSSGLSAGSSDLECSKTLFVLIEGATRDGVPEEDWFITIAEEKIISELGDYKISGLYDVIKIRNTPPYVMPNFVETNGEELVSKINEYFADPSRDKDCYTIVMAGHSAGAIALWHYKDLLDLDGVNVEYLYFDSPYNIPAYPGSVFFTSFIGYTDLANIVVARDEGIASDPNHYDWTDGLSPDWWGIRPFDGRRVFGHPDHTRFRTDSSVLKPIVDKMIPQYEIATTYYPKTVEWPSDRNRVATKDQGGRVYLDTTQRGVESSGSSFIEGAWYSHADETLMLKFDNNYYYYCGMDKYEWTDFTVANSLGRYYNKNIRGNYNCQ